MTTLPAVPPSRPPQRTRRVVVTDHAFVALNHEHAAAMHHGAEFAEFTCRTEDEAVHALTDADVALVNLAPITRRALEALAPQAVVVRYGVGYDNVDLDAANELGITVTNAAGYGTETVADHAAALLLACLRKITQFDYDVRAQRWPIASHFGAIDSFASTTVGLIGTGRIGLALADRLRGFGFTVLASDPFIDHDVARAHGVEILELDELLERSNAISLHAPLTPETFHLLNASRLAKLPRGAVIVNTARGALIDSEALAAAVDSGHISAAGLDVFETEPLASDSPFLRNQRYILTPHVAYYSAASMENLQRIAADELDRALRGEPLLNAVNRPHQQGTFQ